MRLELVGRVGEVETPTPRPGEVLIRVAFAGLRWSDILGRRAVATARAKLETPFVPGAEAAGVVEAVGAGVTRFAPGDRVAALPARGGFAEYLATAENRVTKLPDRVPLETVLVYQVNMIPAWLMIHAWAKVRNGETVLVHAAAGGVGQLAVQILKRRFHDVCVIGLGGSAEKAAAILSNGADYAIDYRASDYVAAVSEIVGVKPPFTPGGPEIGVDVIFNGVGGPTLTKDRQVLKPRGRWVLFGAPGGAPPMNLFENVYESFEIHCASMLTFTGRPEMAEAERFRDAWLANETLTAPVIHPLEDMAAVQAAMERGETHGKLVFRV